uniref:Uncharacterized protein n=1 Tax=Odontella aurita TaxID=265563 RepID=A0A7S4N0E7_9STRA|mmetsp:Transcript_42557/g.129126  ORF Transcript_42557/g.129126 Transcript_42557/m.129126 type:complete len:277 (+) Transcript_42557:116-946(+)
MGINSNSQYDPAVMERVASTVDDIVNEDDDMEDTELFDASDDGYLMDLSRVHRCGPIVCIGGKVARCALGLVAALLVAAAGTGVGIIVMQGAGGGGQGGSAANFSLASEPTQSLTLNDPARDVCHSENPCGLCRGDCDQDGHCADGLVCFERDNYDPVPGCSGDGQWAKDYCYSVELAPSNQLIHKGECTRSSCPEPPFPLGECEGNCDDDSECAGELKCIQRDETEGVPGCYGLGVYAKGYCYDPEKCVETGEQCSEETEGLCCSGKCHGDWTCT